MCKVEEGLYLEHCKRLKCDHCEKDCGKCLVEGECSEEESKKCDKECTPCLECGCKKGDKKQCGLLEKRTKLVSKKDGLKKFAKECKKTCEENHCERDCKACADDPDNCPEGLFKKCGETCSKCLDCGCKLDDSEGKEVCKA